MSSLKRKEAPGGSRPSKRPKSDDVSKDKDSSKHSAKKHKASKDATPKKQPKEAAVPTVAAPTVSLLQADAPLFPRGGASVLTPLEQKDIQIQAKKDALFEEQSAVAGGAKGDKSGKKKKRKSEVDAEPAFDPDAVKAEGLNYKRLVKGSLVLGTVCEINPLGIVVSLPNNLTGRVPITSISEALTERLQASAAKDGEADDSSDEADDDVDLKSMFQLGQYVRAYVLSTINESTVGKPKHQIELSLMPVHANAGMSQQDVVVNCTLMASVASVEDHGFVMDINLANSGLRGFLSKKQVDKSIPEESLRPGGVLLCIAIGNSSNGKVVQLSTLTDRIGSPKNFPSEATTIDTFLPGTAVDVLVTEISPHGLVGKVMGDLDVTADLVHSGVGPDGVTLDEKYKAGDRVKARVICTFPAAKKPKLGISLLSHVTALKQKLIKKDGQPVRPLDLLPYSAQVEKCKVRSVESDIGLYVDVGVDGVSGFVHISRVKDGKVDALFENSGPYKVGSVHPGRVVGFSHFDGLFMVTFEQSVIDQPFLRIEDIPVGAVVPGVIERLIVNAEGFGGVTVTIADGISGLVPVVHLSDVQLQHPEKKFHEGMKVKTRVLSTNPAKHQVRLTLKKTLVNSEAPAIKSFDELAVGLQVPGTIVNIIPHGAIVQYYGRLRGFLPLSEMSEAYIRDVKEHFRLGQTVSTYVLSFDPDAGKLIVSCKDPSAFGLEKQLALKKLQIGDLVSAKVTQKTEDDIFVELTDGSLKALLPVNQLTDKSVSKTESALKKIHVGQVLTDLVVLQKNEARRSITLSHKPSLVKASKEGSLLKSIEDARVGAKVPGFVRNITETVVFVQFAGMVTALMPKSKMPREMREKPQFGMFKSQSIEVKIASVDRDLGRLTVGIPGGEEADNADDKPAEKAVNPVDDSIAFVDDLKVGRLTKARIVAVRGSRLDVKLADNIDGRVHVSQAFDSWDDITKPKAPLQVFEKDQVIPVRVLGTTTFRGYRFLPITRAHDTHSVFQLSAKPSDVKGDEAPEMLTLEKMEVGSTYMAFVSGVEKTRVYASINFNLRGIIQRSEASDDMFQLLDLQRSFQSGTALKVRVLAVDLEKKRLMLSARTPGSVPELTWDKINEGKVLAGKITKVNERQINVELGEKIAGVVTLPDVTDDFDEANLVNFKKFDIVRVAVVEVDKSNKRIRLSMRPSRILNSSLPVKDREITNKTELHMGDVLRGFVNHVDDKGLFLNLGGEVTGFVQIRNLSDAFLKEWKDHFQVDQLVTGRIIAFNNGRPELTLKASQVDEDYVPPIGISDLKEGQIVTGKVRKAEEFGAFIIIDGTANLSGLCHRSEMAERPVKDARTLYSEGDKVKAMVLKVDVKQKRINLGLKPSYFNDADDMDVDDEDAGAPVKGDEESEEDEEMSDAGGAALQLEDDSAEEDGDSDVEMSDAEQEGLTGLDAGGFDWTASALDAGGAAKDGKVDEDAPKKLKKRREPQIQVDRTAELDIHGPKTSSDFERLLLGQPDNSALWIQYMAFEMKASDLASARKVAERAIKTINMKEETEKLNVWIAYLNLEVAYGTDETVEEVFKRACTYNDEQEVHERLASIYIHAEKYIRADELFEKILKKFGSKSADVWINYANFLHTKKNSPDRARALLKRATQVLGSETHLYLALVPKFSALEFRSPNGDRDLGRTLFENLLANYPKKFDLWNQLLDLEISTGSDSPDHAVIRDLFERGSKVKGLKPKQAKVWFRRWAEWEKEKGDAKNHEKVMAKAKEWAKSKQESA